MTNEAQNDRICGVLQRKRMKILDLLRKSCYNLKHECNLPDHRYTHPLVPGMHE